VKAQLVQKRLRRKKRIKTNRCKAAPLLFLSRESIATADSVWEKTTNISKTVFLAIMVAAGTGFTAWLGEQLVDASPRFTQKSYDPSGLKKEG
jgi:hypothetical protein